MNKYLQLIRPFHRPSVQIRTFLFRRIERISIRKINYVNLMEGKISARYSRNAKEESNRGHDVHRTTCMNQSRASVTTE